MDIHGIVHIETDFNHHGEFMTVVGADISALERAVVTYDDGIAQSLDGLLGVVVSARKILGPQDCVSDADRAMRDLVQGKPFVRASARLVCNDVAVAFIEDIGHEAFWWGATGVILERRGTFVSRCRLNKVSLSPIFGARRADPQRIFPGLGG
jgi:hypothetical protein